MEITIKVTPKEIADLVKEVQSQQSVVKRSVDKPLSDISEYFYSLVLKNKTAVR